MAMVRALTTGVNLGRGAFMGEVMKARSWMPLWLLYSLAMVAIPFCLWRSGVFAGLLLRIPSLQSGGPCFDCTRAGIREKLARVGDCVRVGDCTRVDIRACSCRRT